jgi:hypothetical protein
VLAENEIVMMHDVFKHSRSRTRTICRRHQKEEREIKFMRRSEAKIIIGQIFVLNRMNKQVISAFQTAPALSTSPHIATGGMSEWFQD